MYLQTVRAVFVMLGRDNSKSLENEELSALVRKIAAEEGVAMPANEVSPHIVPTRYTRSVQHVTTIMRTINLILKAFIKRGSQQIVNLNTNPSNRLWFWSRFLPS